jgi:hypothetical protein
MFGVSAAEGIAIKGHFGLCEILLFPGLNAGATRQFAQREQRKQWSARRNNRYFYHLASSAA